MITKGSLTPRGVLLFLLLHLGWVVPSEAFTLSGKVYSHEWGQSSVPLPTKLSDLSASTVGDAIYLFGGCTADKQTYDAGGGFYGCPTVGKTAFKFDPATSTFSGLPDMPRERYRHTAAVVGTKIYVLGGTAPLTTAPWEADLTDVDVFDTVTDTWMAADSCPQLPHGMRDSTSFVIGDAIYMAGGYNANYEALAKTYKLDLGQTNPAWKTQADLKRSRGDCGAVAMFGKGYIFGGFHHENNWSAPEASVEMYDPTTDAWTIQTSMKYGRGDKAIAVLNNLVHVVGGENKVDSASAPHETVEVYEPVSDQWIDAGVIPEQRFRFTAAVHGKTIFIFGGQGALVGANKEAGSYYPLLDTVQLYTENVETTVNAAGNAIGCRTIAAGQLVAMAVAMVGASFYHFPYL